jgi:hypothetical protein
VGVYELRPDTRIVVEQDGDDLLVTVAAQAPIRFLRVSESEFGSFAVETTLAFGEAGAGGAGELVLRQNGGALTCRRVV